jgi:hypothetical protein
MWNSMRTQLQGKSLVIRFCLRKEWHENSWLGSPHSTKWNTMTCWGLCLPIEGINGRKLQKKDVNNILSKHTLTISSTDLNNGLWGSSVEVRYIYKEEEYSYWALVCITILHCLTKNSGYSVGRILRVGTEDEEVTRPWDRSDCTYIHIRIPNRSCKCQAPISSGRKDSKELEKNLDLFLQFPHWGTTDQWTSILNVHVHNGYPGVLVVRLRWI